MQKNLKAKVPIPVAVSVLVAALAGAFYSESKALEKAEPPVPVKTSCVRCHTDRETLEKMADKAGDPLYLVHTGDLTLKQLQLLMSKKNKATVWDAKSPVGYKGSHSAL